MDHPWHHGLWFTIKYVDEVNFWEELEPFGTLELSSSSLEGPTEVHEIAWRTPTGEVVLHERLEVTPLELEGAVGVSLGISLLACRDLVLDRTPYTTWGGYGGLTFRGRGDLVDTVLTTPTTGSTELLRGERARWCALSGTIEGAPVGIVLAEHPTNGPLGVPWYASTRSATYGDDGWSNFCNAAILWDGPQTLAEGASLELSYLVASFDGPANHAQLATWAEGWAR